MTETSIKYYFNSTGPRGVIPLALEFRWYRDNMWEIGYGLLEGDGSISYMGVTNNGDAHRILGFVSDKIQLFLEETPGAMVVMIGITPARDRLFRRITSSYPSQVSSRIIAYESPNQ